MAAPSPEVRPDEDQLDEVLHSYLQAVDAGQAPDREDVIRANPELSADLQAFFDGVEDIECLMRAVRSNAPPRNGINNKTTAGTGPAVDGVALEPGEVFGDYELLEEVARGGMGVVWKARQSGVNRIVALKMILAGQLATTAEVQRFRREAEAVGQLDHPNIVPIYDVGEHGGQHFFTMKLIEGGSLAAGNAQCRTGNGGWKQAARLMATVARAVHYAHQRGILHRDLKPANILLDAAGEPHVVDFGLAKRVEGDHHLTQSGAIVGTPSYMAPEQAAGETRGLTTAADTYALGAILYELLAGRPPFVRDTPLDVLIACRMEEPAPPSRYRPKLPRDLETICVKCLAKDPAKRYATAAALADDLDRFLSGEPILARPAGWWERGVKWARRRPAVAAMTLLLAAVGALGVGGVVWQWRKAEAALKALASTLYFKQINLADSYLDRNQAERAATILDECPPELRRWEWHHLKRQSSPEVMRLRGHKDLVVNVAFSPDGKWLASACRDGTVKLWDAASGSEVRSWHAHATGTNSLSFTRDSQRLATAGNDQAVRVWEVPGGKEMLKIPNAGRYAAFSPDGTRIAAGGRDGGSHLYEAATGKHLLELGRLDSSVNTIAFHPDGTSVGIMSILGQFFVADAATGKEMFGGKQDGRGNWGSLTYSPDGRYISVPSLLGNGLIDARTGKPSGPENNTFNGLTRYRAFSSDSRYIALVGDQGRVIVFEAQTGTTVFQNRLGSAQVTSVAFHPNSHRLAVGRGTTVTVEAFVAKVDRRPKELGERRRTLGYGHADLSRDGRRVATIGRENADLCIYSLDGSHPHRRWSISDWGTQVCFSPDGRRVAVTRHVPPRSIRVFASDTGAELSTLQGFLGDPTQVAYSPDGTLIAGGGYGLGATLWDGVTGEKVWELITGKTSQCVAFSPDGKSLAIGHTDGVQVWDPRSGTLRFALTAPSDTNIVAFSPDGRLLARGSVTDGTVHVWEVPSGRLHHVLRGHSGYVWDLGFSPDGHRLATGGTDGALKVWDTGTGQEVLRLPAHGATVTLARFTPDGNWLISAGVDGVVKIWDGTPLAADNDE